MAANRTQILDFASLSLSLSLSLSFALRIINYSLYSKIWYTFEGKSRVWKSNIHYIWHTFELEFQDEKLIYFLREMNKIMTDVISKWKIFNKYEIIYVNLREKRCQIEEIDKQ